MKKILSFFIMEFFIFSSAYATITASVDYPNIQEGEIVELRLSSDSKKQDDPDLSVLDENFHVLGTMTSSSYQNINGKETASFDLILNLLPKKTGVLTIPSITWEKEKSNSLQISVQAADSSYELQDKKSFSITGTLLKQDVYENAALTYRAEALSDVELIDYQFLPPQMENAEIVPVGNVQIGQRTKDGKVYRTYTQNFVIFPQKAGNAQAIKGAGFEAVFLKGKRQKRTGFEPLIYGPLSTPKEKVFLRANDESVDVLARPMSWDNKWWLPAQKVEISQAYTPKLENIKVGQSVARTIQIDAYGVMGVQLPDIQMPESENFKIYAEEPQKSTFFHPQFGIGGTLKQRFVYVPLKSGTLNFPEVKISWFNTQTKTDEVAVLDGVNVSVEPSASTIMDEKPLKPSETPAFEQQKKPEISIQQNKYAKENNMLYFIAGLGVGFILFMLTLLVLFRPKKKKLPDLYLNK